MTFPERPVEIRGVPQTCGTCGHPHGPGVDDSGWPLACRGCGCDDFRLSDDALDAMAEREHQERALYPDGTLLTPDLVEGLLAVCRGLEADYQEHIGWDGPPLIGALIVSAPTGGGRTVPGPHGPGTLHMAGVQAVPLRLSRDFYDTAGYSIIRAFESLGRVAEQSPIWFDDFRRAHGMDPAVPVVGWWSVVESYIRDPQRLEGSAADDPSLATDELRQVCLIDVDERCYEVTRQRSTDTQHVGGIIATAQLRADIAASGPVPAQTRTADGLPVMVDALRRLVRLTRAEAEARAALGGQG